MLLSNTFYIFNLNTLTASTILTAQVNKDTCIMLKSLKTLNHQ